MKNKKLNLPKAVKIGGKIYDVVFPFDIHKEWKRENSVGYIDHEGLKIYLSDKDHTKDIGDDTRAKTVIFETLIHEILHGIDVVYNGDKLKEEDVHQIAEGLLQVLIDNPELVQVLIDNNFFRS